VRRLAVLWVALLGVFGGAVQAGAAPISLNPNPLTIHDYDLSLAPADTADATLVWTLTYNGATLLDPAYAFFVGGLFVAGSQTCVLDCAFVVNPGTSFTIVTIGPQPTLTYETQNPFLDGSTSPIVFEIAERNGSYVPAEYVLTVPEPGTLALAMVGAAYAFARRRSDRAS
jgi:hypothetical protein